MPSALGVPQLVLIEPVNFHCLSFVGQHVAQGGVKGPAEMTDGGRGKAGANVGEHPGVEGIPASLPLLATLEPICCPGVTVCQALVPGFPLLWFHAGNWGYWSLPCSHFHLQCDL